MRILLLNTRLRPLLDTGRDSDLPVEILTAQSLRAMVSTLTQNTNFAVLISGKDDMERLIEVRKLGFAGPVLILTEGADARQRTALLQAGADDVVEIPAAAIEIEARLRAIMRRMQGFQENVVSVGSMSFFLDGRHPQVEGRTIALSGREYDVLRELVLNQQRVLSRRAIYDALYALRPDPPYEKIIEVYLCRLRAKLAPEGLEIMPKIQHFSGRGYRLTLPHTERIKPRDPAEALESAA